MQGSTSQLDDPVAAAQNLRARHRGTAGVLPVRSLRARLRRLALLGAAFGLVSGAGAMLAACAHPGGPGFAELPPWLQAHLARVNADARHPSVIAVWEWPYQGRTVYEIQAGCCDRFNELYYAQGTYLCAPTGGYTGRGDGKCPDAVAARAAAGEQVRKLWYHEAPAHPADRASAPDLP